MTCGVISPVVVDKPRITTVLSRNASGLGFIGEYVPGNRASECHEPSVLLRVYNLSLKLILPWKRRHHSLSLIAMTENNLIKWARFCFSRPDFLNLYYPPTIVAVAVDNLNTATERDVLCELEVLSVTLHKLLKVRCTEIDRIL